MATDEKARRGGVRGNERLTGMAAIVLVVLLGVEAVTLPTLDSLLSLHIFVGVLLIPPVLLKIGSVVYRFLRYYARAAAYRWRGAPPVYLRVLAPLLVASTLSLLGSGVGLLMVGPGANVLRTVHTASFAVFGATIAVHVLAHLRRLPGLATADARAARVSRLPGARARIALVVAAVAVGGGLAVVAIDRDGSWVHRRHRPRPGGGGRAVALPAPQAQSAKPLRPQ